MLSWATPWHKQEWCEPPAPLASGLTRPQPAVHGKERKRDRTDSDASGGSRSLLIALDDVSGTLRGGLWIEARLVERAPLPQ